MKLTEENETMYMNFFTIPFIREELDKNDLTKYMSDAAHLFKNRFEYWLTTKDGEIKPSETFGFFYLGKTQKRCESDAEFFVIGRISSSSNNGLVVKGHRPADVLIELQNDLLDILRD